MVSKMLTTIDNPFDPFTQWESWYSYDIIHGYNTCAYLDNIAQTSDEFSDIENKRAVEEAMKEIVAFNPRNIYKVVTKEVSDPVYDKINKVPETGED